MFHRLSLSHCAVSNSHCDTCDNCQKLSIHLHSNCVSLYLLQCGHKVEDGHETWHIIGKHFIPEKKEPLELKIALANWASNHLGWIRKVSKAMIEDKGYCVESYVNALAQPNVVCDEMGLLILSRMYELKLCVLFERNFWTCLSSDEMMDNDIFLALTGKCEFVMTRKRPSISSDESLSPPPQPDPSAVKTEPLPVAHSTPTQSKPKAPPKPKPQAKPKGPPKPKVPPNTADVRPKAPPKSTPKKPGPRRSVTIVPPKSPSPKSKSPVPSNSPEYEPEDNRRRGWAARKAGYIPESTIKDWYRYVSAAEKKELREAKKRALEADDETDSSTAKKRKVDSTSSSASNKRKVDSTPSSASNKRKRASPPPQDNAAKKAKVSKPVASQDTSASYSCLVKSCKKTFDTKKELYAHLRSSHKKFRFQCSFCDEDYATQYGLDKHIKKHLGPQLPCKFCGKLFHHPHEVKDHERIHTGEFFTCDTCGKTVNTKRGLVQHMEIHTDKKSFVCQECKKGFKTQAKLNQHVTGEHEGGSPALCGFYCKWPRDKTAHEKKCKKCAKLKEENKKYDDKLKTKVRKYLE